MTQKIEEIQNREQILFITKKRWRLIQELHNRLTTYGYQIFFSPAVPKHTNQFKIIFICNNQKTTVKLIKQYHQPSFTKDKIKLIAIFLNDQKAACAALSAIKSKSSNIYKIINCDNTDDLQILEQIFWIVFSSSDEIFFNLETTLKKQSSRTTKKPIVIKMNLKTVIKLVLTVFLTVELFFILPLISTALLLYQSFNFLRKSDYQTSKQYLTYAQPVLAATQISYQAARPILSFFYLALLPDNLVVLEDNAFSIIDQTINLTESGRRLMTLMLKTELTADEQNEIKVRLILVKHQTKEVLKKLTLFFQKLDQPFDLMKKIKPQINTALTAVKTLDKFLNYTDVLFGYDRPRKYLLLFQNNMELRPGGGFIGSFGTVVFANYHLKELAIKDIYEADGQLKINIKPPTPITQYLHQPHWFLRDSNFSPDFSKNFQKAEFFLDKELQLTNFDGGFAITTTAINFLLEAIGEVYLPDYQETINADNFYIKTQIHAEKDFFPGSIQKKSFLSSLTKALIFKLENASLNDLGRAIRQALEEKQIVAYFKNNDLKTDRDLLNWNGQVIAPKCLPDNERPKTFCLSDNLFPFDANLGVNKANFFVSRFFNLKIKIGRDGRIENTLAVKFKNDSPGEVFPGGTYKNYFQVYLPLDINIGKITKNGVLVEDYELSETTDFTILAFYFEVPPQKIADIKISYRLPTTIVKGENIYQLIIQKQIGALNNDLVLDFYLPPNISLVKKNFAGLAKDHRLVYNTNLSHDKIFVIELLKE